MSDETDLGAFHPLGTGAEEIRIRLADLADHLFEEYVPAKVHRPFQARLKAWLSGVGDSNDERLLLEMLETLYFVGQKELDVLYRQVFRTDITWWLCPDGLLTDTESFDSALQASLERTWFCPLTDSMNIAHFHHVNGIRDRDLRPEWRALAKFSDSGSVKAYIETREFHRLVLLEDFVGTGTQAKKTLEWTLEHFPDLHLLFCPLVICRAGLDALTEVLSASPNASVRPGVIVPECCEIGTAPTDPGESRMNDIRDLLMRIVGLVGLSDDTIEKEAFGFGELGVLSVLYTNCPNNAPPALHYAGGAGWEPLFPRSVRV